MMKEYVDAYVARREVVEGLKQRLAEAQRDLDRAELDLIGAMESNDMKSAQTTAGSFALVETVYPALNVPDRDDPLQVQAAWDRIMEFASQIVYRDGQNEVPLTEYLMVPARINLQSMRRRDILQQVFAQVDDLGLVIPDELDLKPRRSIRWTRPR